MTDPTQHNCPHTDSGWCLVCVGRIVADLNTELELLRESYREQRRQQCNCLRELRGLCVKMNSRLSKAVRP